MIDCDNCFYHLQNRGCGDPYEWVDEEGGEVCRMQYGAICLSNYGLDLKTIISLAHANVREKGFWNVNENNMTPDVIGSKLMLIVTELAEGMEAVRTGNLENLQPNNGSLLEELADAVIRICDLCGQMDFDLDQAVRNKIEFNKTREYLHGKEQSELTLIYSAESEASPSPANGTASR